MIGGNKTHDYINKRPYVEQSIFAAYMLIPENHLLPHFGDNDTLNEKAVKGFVLNIQNYRLQIMQSNSLYQRW